VFDGLKARLDHLFAEAAARPDARSRAGALREALIEAKVGLGRMRDALAASERELAVERAQLETAERRGRLAAEVPDPETVALAERYAAKHRERIAVLEKKVTVQREELALAEREVAEMSGEFRAAREGLGSAGASAGAGDASPGLDAAWRDIEAAGGTRPETDLDGELLKAQAERRLHEAAVEAQLAHLKRKLGKE
jgi:hypothetical protein